MQHQDRQGHVEEECSSAFEGQAFVARPDDGCADPLSIVTTWGTQRLINAAHEEAATKHHLFRQLAYEAVQLYPGLQQLLEAAGAQVLASQAAFYVALPDDPSKLIEVPFLSQHLSLLPWREDGQAAQ